MASTDTAFAGSIPGIYDRYLGPMLFAPYAGEVARRAIVSSPMRILETAAGTGIVTAALHDALPEADIVATDLNQAMLDVAADHIRSDRVRFQAANAQALPFGDGAFDLVVCQFGVMFFPDKIAANREARRVLGAGGRYIVVIWDELDRNPGSRGISDAVAALFPDDPPGFLERAPFGYADPARIERDLLAGGFNDVMVETVEHRSRLPSARDVAIGMCMGSPLRVEIEERDPERLDEAVDAVAAALAEWEGPNGFQAPMSAHIVTAFR